MEYRLRTPRREEGCRIRLRSGLLDTIQQIRRESPAMKIIAISGSGVVMNVDGLATALESGADDVIVKPFDSADPLTRVTQVLGI
jgi:DNA-binding response OmpR family regulator